MIPDSYRTRTGVWTQACLALRHSTSTDVADDLNQNHRVGSLGQMHGSVSHFRSADLDSTVEAWANSILSKLLPQRVLMYTQVGTQPVILLLASLKKKQETIQILWVEVKAGGTQGPDTGASGEEGA